MLIACGSSDNALWDLPSCMLFCLVDGYLIHDKAKIQLSLAVKLWHGHFRPLGEHWDLIVAGLISERGVAIEL